MPGGGSQPLTLNEFILTMSRRPAELLSSAEMTDLGRRLEISDELVEEHIRFRADAYARNLVCRTPHFELLVLCWEPGQASTVHDHEGCLNVIRVHAGELTNRLFGRTGSHDPAADPRLGSGPLLLARDERVRPGESIGIDRPQIHQLANVTGERLVTVHIYAPPLRGIMVYRPDSGERERTVLRYTLADDFA